MKKICFVISAIVLSLFATAFGTKDISREGDAMSNGWKFLSTATTWYSATESCVIYIYGRYGNGEWEYGYSTKQNQTPGMWEIVTPNRLYASRDCSDFRRNYRYMAGNSYFNCKYKLEMPTTKNGWTFYSTATAWITATESQIIYIWYKQGNGTRQYGYSTENGSTPGMWDEVSRNDLYQSRDCHGFERNYRYTAGCCLYFNIKKQ